MTPKDTIMVADDDRVVATVISEFLRKKSFNVVPAFDAMQAMLGVRNAAPKAVVLDINMPGGTGMEVIRKMKAMTKTTQIPIVVVTASLTTDVADQARALGADEVLTKPIDLGQLHTVLLRVMGYPPAHAE